MPEEKKSSKRSNAEIVESTTIADVYRAAKQLEGVARKTRLIHSDYFSELCHNDVYLKPENLQHTGAFKLRGAYNKISQLTPEERVRGVITASAGNHAQGVAYAARKLGVKAVICMPATTPILKVEGTRALGAEVVLHGDGFDDAYAHSLELQKKHGYVYIHPFNDLQVLLGQGTTALEIIDALKDVDAILCPIGGGGFASGVALATKLVNPNVKVIGVEPENAACMKAALAADKVVTLDSADTVADGCAVKTAGTLTFEFCKKYLDDIITVSEIDIMNALLSLIEKHKLVAEGAGVLSLAALAKLPFHDKKVGSCVLNTPEGERVEKFDRIYLAIGSRPANRVVSTTAGIEVDEKGYVKVVERPFGMTTRRGVFAGGDVVHRPQTVVLAMKAAKEVAQGIAQYVDAIKLLEEAKRIEKSGTTDVE